MKQHPHQDTGGVRFVLAVEGIPTTKFRLVYHPGLGPRTKLILSRSVGCHLTEYS